MWLERRPRKGEDGSEGDDARLESDEESGMEGMVTMGALAAVGVVAVKTGEGAVWESGGSWKVGRLKFGKFGGRETGDSPS